MTKLLAEQVPDIEEITREIGRLEEYLDRLLPRALEFGVRILLALLVFFVGSRVIKILRKVVRRSMERAGADAGVMQFLDSLLKAILYFVLIMLIASGFGVDTTSVIALVGSAGLALGLALQGSMANFAGGVLVLVLKPFKVGDYIIQGELEGTVAEIQMFYTHLLTPDNRRIIIPNGKLTDNSLINVTAQEKRRIDIDVGISYQADLRKAKELCQTLLSQEENILKEEESLVAVTSLEDSAVMLKMRFWVKPEDYWSTRWRMTEEVKLLFDENGIEIPYNQLDVHVHQP